MSTSTIGEAFLEDVLEHHGTKGMKWGVRRRNRVDRHVKVGQGGGNIIDKVRVGSTANVIDLAKTRSFKKSAARKGARMQARNTRIAAGEGKAKDFIPAMASIRTGDLFPSVTKGAITADQKSNVRKMNSGREATLAVLGVVGTAVVFKASGAALNQVKKKAEGG